jgi:hypothetical protein
MPTIHAISRLRRGYGISSRGGCVVDRWPPEFSLRIWIRRLQVFRGFVLATSLALTATVFAQPSDIFKDFPHGIGNVFVAGSSGARVSGSGHIIEDPRPISGFMAVRSNAPVDIRLKASDRESVTVRIDDNLAQFIETKVVPGDVPALEVSIKPEVSFRSQKRPVVLVEYKAINELVVRGSGDIRADSVKGDQLAVSISGSGDVRIDKLDVGTLGVSINGSGDFRAAGRADQQGYRIAGSGDVESADLAGRIVKVAIAGSGDVAVNASEELEATVSGSGDVKYRGNPKVTQRVSGPGGVHRAR